MPGKTSGSIAIAAITIFSSCNLRPAIPELIPEINIVEAGQKTIPVFTDYVGTTYGESDVDIQTRIDGLVTGIHFTEGEFVNKGQLLYTIDDIPQRNKVDGAAARVAQANTQLVKAKADLDRVKPLADLHALSQRDLDAANAGYNAALSEVEIAKASLSNANVELGYSRITAPISGIIGISKVQVGDYVSRMAVNGSLNTISSVGDVRVRFAISENEYLRFAKLASDSTRKAFVLKIPVQLVLSDGSIYPEEGTVNIANRQIDPATGSLLLQASFKNPIRLLRPGQYVKVRFKTNNYENAVVIPQQAVNQMQNIFQVFVLTDSNQLAPITIKPGQRSGSNLVVTSGLKAGQKIAVVGNAGVKPGMVIKPVPLKWNYDSTSAQ
jgi:membrane fusion protein (multidrug efflux system)